MIAPSGFTQNSGHFARILSKNEMLTLISGTKPNHRAITERAIPVNEDNSWANRHSHRVKKSAQE
jgi:hypothetical protein